ncbi:UDP-glucose 4-epimerase [Burkholderia dolosa PC543]|nr:UDP-glucose 4-epimerase [Burkholderia dolosa PC543]
MSVQPKEVDQMALSGELHDADWTVAVETVAAEAGGYRCRVHVTLTAPNGACERTFAHSRTHATEHEAALEGLRAGMTWIEMKRSDTFTI